jgi:hypothetical protein
VRALQFSLQLLDRGLELLDLVAIGEVLLLRRAQGVFGLAQLESQIADLNGFLVQLLRRLWTPVVFMLVLLR